MSHYLSFEVHCIEDVNRIAALYNARQYDVDARKTFPYVVAVWEEGGGYVIGAWGASCNTREKVEEHLKNNTENTVEWPSLINLQKALEL